MNPLRQGADIVYHSGTKYLSGHHDLMAGVIGARDDKVGEQLYFMINATGVGLAPFECFLLLRGLKTLSVRLERQQRNAILIAEYLESQGFRVRYPGLNSHPQFELHRAMARGPGAVLSFETGSIPKSEIIVEETRLWAISVSFGCVNSLIRYLTFLSPPFFLSSEKQNILKQLKTCLPMTWTVCRVECLMQVSQKKSEKKGLSPKTSSVSVWASRT